MPHLNLPEALPGIRGLMAFRPETARPLNELVETLLWNPNSLTPGERELIATYVSAKNDCYYCQNIHGAVAAQHLGGATLSDNEALVQEVKQDFESAHVSNKLKSLLNIAGKVQQSGKQVRPQDIARAREYGATDIEIHDTVLIAAAFCMFNRYVDGLATWAPEDADFYRGRGEIVARNGYVTVNKDLGRKAEAGNAAH